MISPFSEARILHELDQMTRAAQREDRARAEGWDEEEARPIPPSAPVVQSPGPPTPGLWANAETQRRYEERWNHAADD